MDCLFTHTRGLTLALSCACVCAVAGVNFSFPFSQIPAPFYAGGRIYSEACTFLTRFRVIRRTTEILIIDMYACVCVLMSRSWLLR